MKPLAKYKYKTGKKGEISRIFTDEQGKERFMFSEDDFEEGERISTCPVSNFFRFYNFRFTEISLEFHNFLNCKIANNQIEIDEAFKGIEEGEVKILEIQKRISDNRNKIKILELVNQIIEKRKGEVVND